MDHPRLISSVYRFGTRLHRKGLNNMLSTTTARHADHLNVTEGCSRREILSPATVVEMRDESKSVKVLLLQVTNKDFSFRAGQWVDTFIPGVETVGGFSMCSSPLQLQREGTLVLAVKYARHPPAHWVHTKCRVGDTVLIRAGGDFSFDPSLTETDPGDMLLIAGGVGINPLYSMVNHVADLNSQPHGPYKAKVLLLFSARTLPDLIFRDKLESISASHANIKARFFATRESLLPESIKGDRISLEDIQKSIDELRREKLKVYMCGPSPMIESMEEYCLSCDIAKEHILYERWW